MKIKTAELTGKPLDWALAKTKVSNWAEIVQDKKVELIDGKVCVTAFGGVREFVDHTDHALCLGFIEKHLIDVTYEPRHKDCPMWVARIPRWGLNYGITPSEAVARCVVQMQLGDEVDVPDELCVGGLNHEK